jgi:hypothetical protein
MNPFVKNILLFVLLIFLRHIALAQTSEQIYKAAGSPVNPKVVISWNRYNDHAGIGDILKKIVKALS